MVDRGVRKAEKNLFADRALQLAAAEQVRQQPVGIVAADGAQNHLRRGVGERLQQVGGARLRVGAQIAAPAQRVVGKADVQPALRQPRQSALQLVARKRLAQRAAGQAGDDDVSDHNFPSRRGTALCFSIPDPALPGKGQPVFLGALPHWQKWAAGPPAGPAGAAEGCGSGGVGAPRPGRLCFGHPG